MTRGHVSRPVWVWSCDECGAMHNTLAWTQQQLPSVEAMEAEGWYIAPFYGDMCPSCVEARGSKRTGSST